MQSWQQFLHSIESGKASKKSGLVGTLPAENSGTFLAAPKKTYINGFRRVVVVVVGWGVQNSRTFFCEYTLRRRWVVFGNRLKGWRSWPVYRSALPPQSCASWAVAGVPRFKAWSRAACLASRSSQDKTRLGPRYDNHSFEEKKRGGNKKYICPPIKYINAHQWAATRRRSYPFHPEDLCLVIFNLRPQIVLNLVFEKSS